MIRDVTEEMRICRESGRHLWKTCYMPMVRKDLYVGYNWDMHDAFEALFKRLLCDIVSHDPEGCSEITIQVRVKPGIPVTMTRDSQVNHSGNTYWQTEETPEGLVEARFVEFWDWDSIEGEFEFVRARVVKAPEGSLKEGHDILIDPSACQFFVEDE